MGHVGAPGGLEQAHEERYEPEDGTDALDTTHPRGLIRRISLHNFDRHAFALQQPFKLPGLVGHAAGWWRHRPDQQHAREVVHRRVNADASAAS